MQHKRTQTGALWIIALFALAGTLLLIRGNAATTNVVAVQVETGTKTSNVSTYTQGLEPGGSALRFSGAPTGFLGRNGTSLQLDGQPYRFAGVNAYGLATCEGTTYSTADLNQLFAATRSQTLTRIWATERAALADLDRVVQAAEANNQMLILSLIDGANNCNKDSLQLNRAWYQSGYQGAYYDWIRTIVPRYKDSKAIGMWEIANEPGWGCAGGDCGVTAEEMKSFLHNAAALIKSQDQNHLVETGAMGGSVAAMSWANFAYTQDSPFIDVTSIHDYEYDYMNGNMGVDGNFVAVYKAGSTSIAKPIIIGEVGAVLNQPTNTTCYSAATTIDTVLQNKLSAYFAHGASGVLAWNWMKAKPSWIGTGCGAYQHNFYGTGNSALQLIKNYSL